MKDSLISIETYNITHPCALAGAKHCLRIRLNSCSALRARLSLHPSCDCVCVTASTVVTISNIHPCRHIIPPCTPCHCFCPLSVWLPHCLAVVGLHDNRWRHSSCSWRETMVTVIPAYGGHCGAWHRHPGPGHSLCSITASPGSVSRLHTIFNIRVMRAGGPLEQMMVPGNH